MNGLTSVVGIVVIFVGIIMIADGLITSWLPMWIAGVVVSAIGIAISFLLTRFKRTGQQ